MSSSPPQGSISNAPNRPTRDIPAPPPIITDDKAFSGVDDVQVKQSPGPSSEAQQDITTLTPLRAHYLKKSLIQLQFHNEIDAITTSAPNNISTFSYLGPPFTPPPKDAPRLDLPFLKYIFRQYVVSFPFMAAAPKDFYSDKLQPFMASVLSRNLSPNSVLDDGSEGSEQAMRQKLQSKLEKNLTLFVGGATKLVEQEEVVRLKQADLDRLEALSKKRQARLLKQKDIFEVNIVSVRTVTDKGRMRSRVHEEFIVRTRRSDQADVFVSRRYGDFKTLATELQRAHPNEYIPLPPAKDRTTVTGPAGATLSPAPSFQSVDFDEQSFASQQATAPSRLAREKNRLTLRAYLHSLLSSSAIASSPVLRSFLLSDPTRLSQEEEQDSHRREEADRTRDDGRKRFAHEIASRVEGLRGAVKSVKGDVMGKDGLTHIFATIKTTPDVRSLPDNYQAVLEWARISLASTVFQHLVAADNSSELFASLKRIHGLMPYFMLKTALKITNPVGMIRTILDLFLAQPFGGRSLLQRMFTSSLSEEVKALEEEINAVKDTINDPIMCEKVRQFVYAPREIQEIIKADAAADGLNVLTVVLRSGNEPVLSRAQIHRLSRSHKAHLAYLHARKNLADSDDDDGPQDEDAWLFEDLRVLTNLYSRLRDREQLIALIFEGFTAELLKDIITIFYAPLAQVYRAASIADSLGDLQNFINDLIKTVESTENMSQGDPHGTVTAFIDLIQRHEQSFYNFVHKVHSKGEGLFDSLMKWMELFITVMREGLGEPISLEFLLPHTGEERQEILQEIDAVALYHYKLKVAYEDRIRRRFGKAQSKTDADAEDEAAQALVDGVVGEINFGELVQGDVNDLAAEYSDSSEEESSSEDETEADEDSEESSSDGASQSVLRRQTSGQPPHTAPPRNPQESRSPTGSGIISKTLRTSRSLISLNKKGKGPKEKRNLSPAPPLPIRNGTPSSPMKASLSASPRPSSDSRHPSTPSRISRAHTPIQPTTQKKRKTPEVLHPPDLQHLPKLLPVFIEMIRPLLRPRQQ